MSKFNEFIEKRNFKKIFIIYIIIAIVLGAASVGAVGYVYGDKIKMAVLYERASDLFKKQTDSDEVKKSVDALAETSDDIADILILDDQNNIIYSAKNSKIAQDALLELNRIENGSKYLVSEKIGDAVFRIVKKDEFMLSLVFADHYSDINEEYDEDNFYRRNFINKNLYLIGLLNGKKNSEIKGYVISDPSPVPYGMLSLKITASILMLLFMLYWIIVAIWVYQNAMKSRLCAPVWGIITLFTNIAGVIVYVAFKHINNVCPLCGTVQARENIFCTECGSRIGVTCSKCGHSLKSGDTFCPKCGNKKD